MSHLPISDYALVSDCRSAALVSRDGSVDWLCFPRFDQPSVFGRILDERAGHWSIRPVGNFTVERRYFEDTMVLATTFKTASGQAVLVDGLAVGRNERGHDLGRGATSTLLRAISGVEGEIEVELELTARPEYGLVLPLLEEVEGGVRIRGGSARMRLCAPMSLDVDEFTVRRRWKVRDGDIFGFALQYRSTSEEHPELWTQDEIFGRLEDTAQAWRTWSALHQNYSGPWVDLVRQSGRVLYALTYWPTGAIVAAATTSLPETPGGYRNWDYRYAWVRDASFTLQALWVAACPDEAHKFFDFMTGAASSQVRTGTELQIMFGVGGEHDLTERELPHLSGWRNSAPVRIGNGAWSQRQLDVYGELLDAALRLPDQLERLTPAGKAFFAGLADSAAAHWTDKDQGVWEIRGEPQHFVYSKLMCWVALDRAIELAGRLGAGDRVEGWKGTRDEIADAILTKGWNEKVGAFTQAFGSDNLDAATLMMPIVGCIDGKDPRMKATIDAIAEHLTDERGLVYRYRGSDGLPGDEGTFLLCTFWLAQAQALAGELDRARATFETAIAFCNDVGLLAEEVDGQTGELLGNFPQAFSHIGLVNAAWAIFEAERKAAQ